jgi:3-hydroxyisobutyrate dehydrogenase
MMNQMCIAGAVQGLSEAINFGINAGLDMDKVMETISKGCCSILADGKQISEL